jgi:hypothetical protein
LAHLTCSPRVWNLSSESDGYFEVIEGIQNDATYAANPATYPGMSFFGDVDDVVAMTIRSGEKPFRGRWVDGAGNMQIVESYVAEVVWFVAFDDVDETDGRVDMNDRVNLYRRVLLVRPDLALNGSSGNMTAYFLNNDISARPVGANLQANSLGDLTLRENRYAHDASTFPHAIQGNWLRDRRLATGEDILMTDVAGFDIRVWSPDAPMKSLNNQHFSGPGDPNYTFDVDDPADPIDTFDAKEGAFVDLGWGGTSDGLDNDGDGATDEADEAASANWFSVRPGTLAAIARTWCSWSPHYFYGTQATDGLDNDGDGQVDEEDEMTSLNRAAPYPRPVRGLQLTMRGIEKSTRNIRQVTVSSSFVPE